MPTRVTTGQVTAPTSRLSPARTAFWHSPYTNEDAKVVKAKLRLPTLDAAKEHIGNAILGGREAELNALGVTRYRFDDHDALNKFKRSGFTDADVKQAKKALPFLKGKSDVEVQTYLGLKLRNVEVGYRDGLAMLNENGITEDKYDSHELMGAFKRSGMTTNHVNAAREQYEWLADSSVKEIKEYLGLKVLNAADGYRPATEILREIETTLGWGRGGGVG